MEINTTKPESLFNSLCIGLSKFVSNTFAQYEEEKRILIEEIKKLREENSKQKKEIDELKEQLKLA